ncbi:hypothetical protein C0V82_05290 [Niveispirillum cyanobacteriorum]|uniref:TolA protein n=2 Tax=Niveispirillum cyanobacteriorum TaxID=1612173 RepID=A0A2K9N9A0_9PROT|nr:hypothetical protein C0V82_05290 [Niveispirillum cyanobacteriorum]
MENVMVSVLGTASGVFAVSARQFQSKTQEIWQGLKKDAANGSSASASRPSSIQDLIDPDKRARLEAQRKDADALATKLSSGGEDAKEAAARKKDEAKQKLKMLKLQAQLAAASGDKKAAARIAKEAASVAKELGQAAKDYAGSGDAAAAKPDANAAQGTAATPATGGDAVASAEAQAVAQQATQTASQGRAGEAAAGTPANDTVQAQRDAILRDGAARSADAQFESDTRGLMDQLRAIHQQMKNLARKDGSAGTKAEMERAEQDMAEGDRTLNEAFGPPGPPVEAVAAPARVDIKV